MGISREQARNCFASDDLVGMGMEADAVRRRVHPEGVVTYSIQSQVSYSGEVERLCGAIAGAADFGASAIRIAELPADGVRLEVLERILRDVRQEHAGIWIEALSAPEVRSLAADERLTVRDVLKRLHEAGLSSIVGEGASLSGSDPSACSVPEWIEVHGAAHAVGMRTRAVMTFGAGESLEQRIEFLEAVRRLQEQTGGFSSFVAVAAEPANGRQLDGVTAVERLKTLAVARMYLDNIENLQAGSPGSSLKVLQTELRFGANDAGQATPEGSAEEDLRRIIRDAGFRPAQRDAAFRAMYVA